MYHRQEVLETAKYLFLSFQMYTEFVQVSKVMRQFKIAIVIPLKIHKC